MSLWNSVKSVFMGFSAGQRFNAPASFDSAISADIIKPFVNFLAMKSKFGEIPEEVIYEDMYKFEPEVGGSIDRFASMVRETFKRFVLKNSQNYDKLPDFDSEGATFTLSEQDVNLADEMIDTANMLADLLHVPDLYETYAEIIYMFGMIVLKKDGLSYNILPNSKITILDTLDRIRGSTNELSEKLITEANWVIVDEGESTQDEISKGNFIIKKFRDTPVHMIDKFGRRTFGIYAISPLQRAVIPVWQKRLIMIHDMLWRNKNVPREHHKIHSESFNPAFYIGTPKEIKDQMEADVRTYLTNYKSTVENQTSDMVYISTDNVDIESIEHNSTNYMSPNDLLTQISGQIWSSLNIPRSIVEGSSNSTFASELVISSYTAMRVKQSAQKIGDIILQNIKARLLEINPKYPVDLLEIKHEFTLENNKLENMKMAAIAGSLNSYTRSEIREMGSGSAPLSKEQLKNDEIINTNAKAEGSTSESAGTQGLNKTKATTPESRTQQPTTVGSSVADNPIQNK